MPNLHSPPKQALIPTGDTATMRKAAVLIASLPLDEATRLTKSLGKERLERLADAMATLDAVPTKEQRLVARELGDRTGESSKEPSRNDATIREHSDRLEQADPAIVAGALRDELPQTIAVVFSQMAPSAVAVVLRRLTTDRQLAVVKRMASLQPGDVSAITTLLQAVSQSVHSRSQPLRETDGGEAFLAHVIHCTDRATEKALLENLAEEDRDLVDRLLQRMYVLRDSRRPCRDDEPEESHPHRRAS